MVVKVDAAGADVPLDAVFAFSEKALYVRQSYRVPLRSNFEKIWCLEPWTYYTIDCASVRTMDCLCRGLFVVMDYSHHGLLVSYLQ